VSVAGAVDLWKRKVPRRYQQWVIETRLGARRAIDAQRPLPEFLVIGAQRAGTSSLYKWLEAHPDVVASLRKETEYLTARWCRGEGWYRGHFPSRHSRRVASALGRPPLVTFEASPNYLFHPLAPLRAATLVPDAKLVALLRNPVDRAFSHFQHEVRAGREDLSFEDALDAEAERLAGEEGRMAADPCYRSLPWEQKSYVRRGHYAGQVERWVRAFGRDRLLVVRSEDLYADTAGSYGRILAFLGLAAWSPASFDNFSYTSGTPRAAPPSALAPATRQRLEAEFADANRELYDLLGEDLGWGA